MKLEVPYVNYIDKVLKSTKSLQPNIIDTL